MGYEYRWFAPAAPEAAARLRAAKLRKDIYFPATDDVGLKLRDGRGNVEVKVCTERSAPSLCDGAIEHWTKKLMRSDSVVADGCIVDFTLLQSRLEALAHEHVDPGSVRAQVAPASVACVDAFDRRHLTVHIVKERTHTAFGEQQLEDATLLLQARRTDTVGREILLEEAWRSVAVEVGSAQAIAATVELLETLQPPSDAVVGGYPRMVVLFAQRALDRAFGHKVPRRIRSVRFRLLHRV